MRCPYCNSEMPDSVEFCTECGATLNHAAVQQQIRMAPAQKQARAAADSGLVLGAAARQARMETAVTQDQLVSPRVYNGVLLGVLLWGVLVNAVLCFTVGSVNRIMNPVVFAVLYVICAGAGILISHASDKPLFSFLGYNLVVLPFGLVISTLVEAYGGPASSLVAYAFLYTLVITVGMTGAALAFPELFSKLGGVLLGVLVGLVLCELLLLILRIPQTATDWIVAALFSLYIGYDVYRSQQFPRTVDNAVDCALDIYLDIANLFIRILSILAKKKD